MGLTVSARLVFNHIIIVTVMLLIEPVEMHTPQVMRNPHNRGHCCGVPDFPHAVIVVQGTVVPMSIPKD
jgi:hypothetical protein